MNQINCVTDYIIQFRFHTFHFLFKQNPAIQNLLLINNIAFFNPLAVTPLFENGG